MIVCEPHRYADPLCPCPWPGCPNGTKDRWFAVPDKKGRVEAVRIATIGGEDLYAWIPEGRTAAVGLPKLSCRRGLLEFNRGDVDLIWHYTRRESAASILRSGEIWISHHGSLNDAREWQHGRDLAHAAVRASSAAADVCQVFMRALNRNPDVFVFSFSTVEDDLPQWRAYGEQCCGVSLGFEAFGFLPLLAPDPQAFNLSLVSYDRPQQAEAFEYVVALAAQAWELDKHRRTVDIPRFTELLTRTLFEVIPLCKDAAFRSERECRLVVLPRLALFGVANKLSWRTRNAGGAPIPYTTTRDIDASFTLPLRRVMVGPHAPEEDAIVIRRALDESGWDVPVERSGIPLRRGRC